MNCCLRHLGLKCRSNKRLIVVFIKVSRHTHDFGWFLFNHLILKDKRPVTYENKTKVRFRLKEQNVLTWVT